MFKEIELMFSYRWKMNKGRGFEVSIEVWTRRRVM